MGEGDVDEADVPAVNGRVRLRCALQRESVRGEQGERKLRKEGLSRLEPPPPIPADGSMADCRDLAASDLQTPPMELSTQGEGDRLQAIPRSHDRDTLRREEAEAIGERLRIPCRLHDEVRTASPRRGAYGVAQLLRFDGLEPTRLGDLTAPRRGITSDDDRAVPREEDRRENPDRTEADDGRDLAMANPSVERDLKRRLDKRKERRRPRVAVAYGHDVGGGGDEAGLVRVECEDAISFAQVGPLGLDRADGAVAIRERVLETAREPA